MYTVIESPVFQKQVVKLWSDEERVVFINWISANPLDGDVVPGARGARKVRWAASGRGKSGGARVIYFNFTEQCVVYLVAMYAKADQANMLPGDLPKVV